MIRPVWLRVLGWIVLTPLIVFMVAWAWTAAAIVLISSGGYRHQQPMTGRAP